jgi:hypothetical protein
MAQFERLTGLIGVSTLTLITLAGTMAMPAHSSARTLDILGIPLGVTPSEFEKRVKALDGRFVIRRTDAQLQVPDSIHVSSVMAREASKQFAWIDDQIFADFPAPPNKNVAQRIARSKKYEPGKEPTLDNVERALFEKYGRPGHTVPSFVGRPTMYVWTFDPAGNPTQAAERLKEKCTMVGAIGPVSAYNLPLPQECGVVVVAGVTVQSQNKALVYEVQTTLTDYAAISRASAASAQYVADHHAQQQRAQIRNAGGNKPSF